MRIYVVAALALLVQTLLERRLQQAQLDLSAVEALEAVRTIRHVTFQLQGQQRSGVSAPTPRAHEVLRALGLATLRSPTPPADEPTVAL